MLSTAARILIASAGLFTMSSCEKRWNAPSRAGEGSLIQDGGDITAQSILDAVPGSRRLDEESLKSLEVFVIVHEIREDDQDRTQVLACVQNDSKWPLPLTILNRTSSD